MRLIRKFGIWMMAIGVAFQFLNIITYGNWGIDIDIFGALIFIVGLILVLVGREYRAAKRATKHKGR